MCDSQYHGDEQNSPGEPGVKVLVRTFYAAVSDETYTSERYIRACARRLTQPPANLHTLSSPPPYILAADGRGIVLSCSSTRRTTGDLGFWSCDDERCWPQRPPPPIYSPSCTYRLVGRLVSSVWCLDGLSGVWWRRRCMRLLLFLLDYLPTVMFNNHIQP